MPSFYFPGLGPNFLAEHPSPFRDEIPILFPAVGLYFFILFQLFIRAPKAAPGNRIPGCGINHFKLDPRSCVDDQIYLLCRFHVCNYTFHGYRLQNWAEKTIASSWLRPRYRTIL